MSNKAKTNNFKHLNIFLTVIFSISLFALIFGGFLNFYKNFMLGVFGLVLIPINILAVVVCLFNLKGYKINLDVKRMFFCILILYFIFCLLQTITTRSFDYSSFGVYIQQVYQNGLTPGGVVVGLLVFPIRYFFQLPISYIIYSILLVVMIAVAVNDYCKKMASISRKHKSNIKTNNYNVVQDNNFNTSKEEEKNEEDEESKNLFEQEDEDFEKDENYQKAKDLLGITEHDKINEESQRTYDVLYGNEESKQKAFEMLYPDREKVLELGEEENYLESNLDKYKDNLKPASNLILNDDEPLEQITSSEQESIEYLNRTLPKTAQKGTIIRGDYYKQKNSTIEISDGEISENWNSKENDEDDNSLRPYNLEPENDEEKELHNILNSTHSYNDDNNNFDFEENYYEFENDNSSLNFDDSENDNEIIDDDYEILDDRQEENDDSSFESFDNPFGDVFQSEESKEKEKTKIVEELPKAKKNKKYVKPPVSLLTVESTDMSQIEASTASKSLTLEQTLSSFKIKAKVNQVVVGPAITMYEMCMPQGISVRSIARYSDDMAMALEARGSIRILAPIPGKNAVGVEVPNEKSAIVGFKEVFETGEFDKYKDEPLSFVLGKDIYGHYQFCNLAKAPHVLIAGSTGSGKSVCLNILILSLIYKCSPKEVRFILVDPKRVEFAIYEGLPHLMLPSIITEPEKAVNALNWAVNEMERRFRLFQQLKIKNIVEFNNLEDVKNGETEKMPYIVIIVDELADLMSVARRDLEDKIQRLAAKARAAGMHLVLATQRPSTDVVTGTIKNNLPVRIAFSLASFVDSKTVLDQSGAEKLLGKGDMLYSSNGAEPKRFQSSLVTTEEITSIVEFVKSHNEPDYEDGIEQKMLESQENQAEQSSKPVVSSRNVAETDSQFVIALKIVVETRQASASMLQRRLRIGYNRAGSLIDAMQKMNYISPIENNKRQVLITMDEFREIYGDVEEE